MQGEERREAEELAVKRNEFIAKVRDAVGQGKTVAIVDSGDPLIYGPWAWCLEEFEDLRPVVVPGVSCFNAANAALRRGVTNSDQHQVGHPDRRRLAGEDRHHRQAVRASLDDGVVHDEDGLRRVHQEASINYPAETPVAIVVQAGYAEKSG